MWVVNISVIYTEIPSTLYFNILECHYYYVTLCMAVLVIMSLHTFFCVFWIWSLWAIPSVSFPLFCYLSILLAIIKCSVFSSQYRKKSRYFSFLFLLIRYNITMGARSPAVAGMPANWDWLDGHAGKLSLAGRWPCRQIFFNFFFSSYSLISVAIIIIAIFFRRYVTWQCLTIVPCANSGPRYSTLRRPGRS